MQRFKINYTGGTNTDHIGDLPDDIDYDIIPERYFSSITRQEEEIYLKEITGDYWEDKPENSEILIGRISYLKDQQNLVMVLGGNVNEEKYSNRDFQYFNKVDIIIDQPDESYSKNIIDELKSRTNNISDFYNHIPMQIFANFEEPKNRLYHYLKRLPNKFETIAFDWSTTKFLINNKGYNFSILEAILKSKCLMLEGSFYFDIFETVSNVIMITMGNNLVEGNTRQKISRDGTLNLLNNLDSYIFPEEGNIIRLTDEVIKKITSDTLFSYLNYNLISTDYTIIKGEKIYKLDKLVIAEKILFKQLRYLIIMHNLYNSTNYVVKLVKDGSYPIKNPEEKEIKNFFKVTRKT